MSRGTKSDILHQRSGEGSGLNSAGELDLEAFNIITQQIQVEPLF